MWDFAASIHDHFTCNKYFLNDGFWFFFSFRINPCVWFEVGILYFQRTVILCALSCPSTRRFHDAGTAPSGSSCVANMSNHSGPDESLHRYTKMNFIGSLLCLLTIAGTFQTAKYIYIYDFIYIYKYEWLYMVVSPKQLPVPSGFFTTKKSGGPQGLNSWPSTR